jgi:nicotinamidase-related amidase
VRHDGFHGRAGFGSRPALVVIDVNVGFTSPESPLVCDLEEVVAAIRTLLEEARRAGIPVVFTTVSYTEGDKRTAAAFLDKIPALLTLEAGSPWVEIDPRIAPREGEPVLNKLFASAFFGTALSSLLAANRCDSLIVTGASTSGCVRATVVDAIQHGYRPIVPREAVGDRSPDAHAANLYDIEAKYGDVVSLAEVVEHLEELASLQAMSTDASDGCKAAPGGVLGRPHTSPV